MITESDRASLRQRLESLRVIDSVLPTKPRGVEERRERFELEESVRQGESSVAGKMARDNLGYLLDSDAAVDIALPQLMEIPDMREQLAAFTRAGFDFFQASQRYLSGSLDDRLRVGGSGSVTRIMQSDSTLLLETQRLTVQFANKADLQTRQALERRFGLLHIRSIGKNKNNHVYALENGYATDTCLQLMNEQAIGYAEPDFIEHIGKRASPSDPYFDRQWHHQVIETSAAWSIADAGKGIRVAVVDNGFDVQHTDLSLDGSTSGWFRPSSDLEDADFISGLRGMPSSDHGTACAGMLGSPVNGIGGVGIAHQASLSAVSCLGDQVGSQVTLARALLYALDPGLEDLQAPTNKGADIITCSLGPNGATWQMRLVLKEAINDVFDHGRGGLGTPLFWASTNGNYPIQYDEVCSHDHSIVVGRSTSNDTDDGSGYGPELEPAPRERPSFSGAGRRRERTGCRALHEQRYR